MCLFLSLPHLEGRTSILKASLSLGWRNREGGGENFLTKMYIRRSIIMQKKPTQAELIYLLWLMKEM